MELNGFWPTAYRLWVSLTERYDIEYVSADDWELMYVGAARVSINAKGPENWPSAAMAKLAAQQHYELMRATGDAPDVAASRIPTDPAWYEAKMGETP